MKIKPIILALTLIPSCVLATNLALPSTGIQVAPQAQMDFPEDWKKEDAAHMQEMRIKGYIESDDQAARNLIATEFSATQQFMIAKENKNPYDSHMKKSLSEIKLAIPFNDNIREGVIGFAPIGTYKKGKGWTGVKQFFKNKKLGTCESSVSTYKAIALAQEATTYEVHKKPTTFYIIGSINSGFTYYLSWYDDTKKFAYDMQCAKMVMDADMKGKMIETAIKLDA